MIAWELIKPLLSDLIPELLGVPAACLRWKSEPRASTWVGFPTVILDVKSIKEIGVEEEIRNEATDDLGNLTGDDAEIVVGGQRQFTLSVRIESDEGDIMRGTHAGSLGAALSVRFGRTSSVERLAQATMAVADSLGAIEFAYNDAEGRSINTYVQDYLCLTCDNDVDTTSGAGGYIGRTIIEGTITDGATTIPVTVDTGA